MASVPTRDGCAPRISSPLGAHAPARKSAASAATSALTIGVHRDEVAGVVAVAGGVDLRRQRLRLATGIGGARQDDALAVRARNPDAPAPPGVRLVIHVVAPV